MDLEKAVDRVGKRTVMVWSRIRTTTLRFDSVLIGDYFFFCSEVRMGVGLTE